MRPGCDGPASAKTARCNAGDDCYSCYLFAIGPLVGGWNSYCCVCRRQMTGQYRHNLHEVHASLSRWRDNRWGRAGGGGMCEHRLRRVATSAVEKLPSVVEQLFNCMEEVDGGSNKMSWSCDLKAVYLSWAIFEAVPRASGIYLRSPLVPTEFRINIANAELASTLEVSFRRAVRKQQKVIAIEMVNVT